MKISYSSGIYTITNLVNGKMYVGYASNLRDRMDYHWLTLRNNNHANSHLQRAYNKYGKENFLFEVLLECEKEYLASEENYWCNLLNVHNDKYGYNIAPTTPEQTRLFSLETRNKISANSKGRTLTEETKRKIGATNRRIRELHPYKATDEVKKIISKSSIERWKGEEYRNAVINGVKEKLSKKVYKYNTNGVLMKEFSSMSEAVRMQEGDLCSISRACNTIPHRYKVRGYYWSFQKVSKLEIVNHPKRKYKTKQL